MMFRFNQHASHNNRFPFLLGSLTFVAGLVVLYLHLHYYLPFFADDSLISLRYTSRFLHGQGLTFNNNEFVEGYSNLLWILLVSLPGLFKVNLVTAARAMGFMCSALSLGALYYAYPPSSLKRVATLFVLTCLFSFTGTMAIWTIAGLEQPLVMALLAWILALFLKHKELRFNISILAGCLGGLLCLSRPDSPLFIAAIAGGLLLLRGFRKNVLFHAITFAGLSAVFYLGQLLFRLVYYGQWWSNTAYVKVSPSINHMLTGLQYLASGSLAYLPCIIIFIGLSVMNFRDRPFRRVFIFVFIPTILWAAYLVFIGGDIFPGYRHFTPIMAFMLFGIGSAMNNLKFSAPWQSKTMATAIIILLAIYAVQQPFIGEYTRAKDEIWEWNCKKVSDDLRAGFGQVSPLFAVSSTGCFSYWTNFPMIDMMGLADKNLSHIKTADFGQGRIGHELGNGAYVLSREPDLIGFCFPEGGGYPCYRSGKEMIQNPLFLKKYTLVNFYADCPSCYAFKIWFNTESPRIGIISHGNDIYIPGYLINKNKESMALLSENGTIGTFINKAFPAETDITLSKGTWDYFIEKHGAALDMKVQSNGEKIAIDPDNQSFTLQKTSKVTLSLESHDGGNSIVQDVRLVKH